MNLRRAPPKEPQPGSTPDGGSCMTVQTRTLATSVLRADDSAVPLISHGDHSPDRSAHSRHRSPVGRLQRALTKGAICRSTPWTTIHAPITSCTITAARRTPSKKHQPSGRVPRRPQLHPVSADSAPAVAAHPPNAHRTPSTGGQTCSSASFPLPRRPESPRRRTTTVRSDRCHR